MPKDRVFTVLAKYLYSYGYKKWPFFLFIHWMINCDEAGSVAQEEMQSDMFKWVSDNGQGGWMAYI